MWTNFRACWILKSYREVKASLVDVGFGKEDGQVAAQLLATYAGELRI